MIRIITGRTRTFQTRPPGPPYVLNRDCRQAQGLVAFWPLGEPSARAYYDYVGRGAPLKLTMTGTMPIAAGPFGQGMATSNTGSTSNYFSVPLIVSTPPFTLAGWIYPFSISAYWNLWNIGVDGGNYHNLYINNVGNGAVGASSSSDAATEHIAQATSVLVANVWSHVCGVWTSTALRAAYLNGSGKGTDTTSISPSAMTTSNIGIFPGGFGPMNGRAAHLCLWNRALTDQDVWALYEPRTRWELYYRLGLKMYSFAPPSVIVPSNKVTYQAVNRAATY